MTASDQPPLKYIADTDVDPTVREIVASRLASTMSARGLTQSQVAAASGVSRACISRVLGRQRTITVDALVRVCIAMSLDPAWLLGMRNPAGKDKDPQRRR